MTALYTQVFFDYLADRGENYLPEILGDFPTFSFDGNDVDFADMFRLRFGLEEIGVELVAERKAERNELRLDLGQRLLAEVAVLEHIRLGLGCKFTDGGDVRVVQAVRRTDRKLDLVDGHIQELFEALALVGVLLLGIIEFESLFAGVVDKHVEVAAKNRSSGLERIIRRHATISPNVEDELFIVRTLSHASVLHEEVDASDR